MSDWQSWAGGGGTGATLALAAGWAIKFLRDGRREVQNDTITDRESRLNGLRQDLEAERRENARKDERIDELDSRIRSLQDELYVVQEERRHEKEQHAAELAAVRLQLNTMTRQVEAMQRRLGLLD